MKKSNKWRILVMSDAKGQVKQFSLHKLLFFSFLIIFVSVVITLWITIHVMQTVSGENEHLQTNLEEKVTTVLKQEEMLIQYEEANKEIQKQIEELTILESQLSDIISSLNPDRMISYEEDGPQGGLEWDGPVVDNVDLIPTSNVDIVSLKDEIPVLIEKYEYALHEVEQVKDKLKSVPIYWPADTERITSEFGERSDPFTRRQAFHNGIDLAGPWGTEIYATGDGVVEFADRDGGYGQSIVIDHGNSYKTRYAHLARIDVEVGDTVEQGELIGLMGTTGRSTGVHLHYEIILNGEIIDPFPYMTFLQQVLK